MHELRRFLVDYDMAMLRALAQNRGTKLSTNVQTEAADQLAAELLGPLSVRTALARLGTEARQALERLVAVGGRMPVLQFERSYGQVRPIGPGRLERESPWQDPANAAEELWYAGLVFFGFEQEEGELGGYAFVPGDLLPLLPPAKTVPPTFDLEVLTGPPQAPVEGESGRQFVHDLFVYLVHVQNRDVQTYADGRLAQRDLKALATRLVDDDHRRLDLVRHLAERLGFVERQEGLLRLAADPVKEWLTASTTRRLAALQAGWREDPTWNDLCRVPSLVCDQEVPWLQHYDPVAVRREILSLLARCPEDHWWSLASFVQAVKATQPDFQRPNADYKRWYLRDAQSGDYLSGFESWDRVEGALLADVVRGPLHWLGVVTVAEDAGGVACHLTKSGSRLLGLAAEEAEEVQPPPILVHPDFRVEVPAPISLYACFQLERFAEPLDPTSRGPTQETTWAYRLAVGALGCALERGIRVEQILAFLRQASGDRVPANVAGQMRLWAGRFGQVQLAEVVILTAKSERVLKELSVLPETRGLIGQLLTPTTALVRKQDLPRLRKALAELGFFASSEVEGDAIEHG
ncbi:MAG: helicase-associated domain-containing protein [Anaerolineae bacterium]